MINSLIRLDIQLFKSENLMAVLSAFMLVTFPVRMKAGDVVAESISLL